MHFKYFTFWQATEVSAERRKGHHRNHQHHHRRNSTPRPHWRVQGDDEMAVHRRRQDNKYNYEVYEEQNVDQIYADNQLQKGTIRFKWTEGWKGWLQI